MFFPYNDDNPRILFPFITYLLIVINFFIFLMQILGTTNLINNFAIIPAMSSIDLPYYCLTLITSTFLHGGFIHLIGNIIYLWIFGDNVEGYIGHFNFLIFYISCGFIAGIIQTLYNPISSIPIIGASGSVAGILGAYIYLYPNAKIHSIIFIFFYFTSIKIPAFIVLGLWFIIQLSNGFASLGMNISGGIAWFSHIGGFIAGLIFIYIFKKWKFSTK